MRSTAVYSKGREFVAFAGLFMVSCLLAGCSSATVGTATASPQPSSALSESAAATPAVPSAIPPALCEATEATSKKPPAVGTPTEYLAPKEYTLTLQTNCGEIKISANAAKAPATVTTLGFLANAQYFDGTLCHRLTTSGIFVLQCGDPTATGTGGPGFTFKDENLPQTAGVNYPRGTVAMANSGPNTNGSQFFLVYKDTTLPPNYSIWGEITAGLDWLEKIADLGTADGGPDGAPKYPIEIRSARLK